MPLSGQAGQTAAHEPAPGLWTVPAVCTLPWQLGTTRAQVQTAAETSGPQGSESMVLQQGKQRAGKEESARTYSAKQPASRGCHIAEELSGCPVMSWRRRGGVGGRFTSEGVSVYLGVYAYTYMHIYMHAVVVWQKPLFNSWGRESTNRNCSHSALPASWVSELH